MRVQIRNALDLSAPVNLRRLSPAMKVYAGIVAMYRNTEFYKRGLHKKLEASVVKGMQEDEMLKEALLAMIFKELDSNSSLEKEGKVCRSMVISVDASKKKSLDRVIGHNDFLPYQIQYVQENRDIRLAFKNMPFLIRVSKKIV